MDFSIAESKLKGLSEHLYKANQRRDRVYYMDDSDKAFFSELLESSDHDFLKIIFVISNCLPDDIYDEELTIGYFRDYLKNNLHQIWDELVSLSKMSHKFCQFVMDSWAFGFEEKKISVIEELLKKQN